MFAVGVALILILVETLRNHSALELSEGGYFTIVLFLIIVIAIVGGVVIYLLFLLIIFVIALDTLTTPPLALRFPPLALQPFSPFD